MVRKILSGSFECSQVCLLAGDQIFAPSTWMEWTPCDVFIPLCWFQLVMKRTVEAGWFESSVPSFCMNGGPVPRRTNRSTTSRSATSIQPGWLPAGSLPWWRAVGGAGMGATRSLKVLGGGLEGERGRAIFSSGLLR